MGAKGDGWLSRAWKAIYEDAGTYTSFQYEDDGTYTDRKLMKELKAAGVLDDEIHLREVWPKVKKFARNIGASWPGMD